MQELPKSYNASEVEDKIYQMWLESGYFNPDNLPLQNAKPGQASGSSEPYTVILPPLNVTGNLHMGHAYEDTIQDILIRFKRMQGYKTLWLPGTDHAAIATQAKVEKEILDKEDKSRHDLGRDEFLKRVEAFAKDSHDTIVSQLKKMGASVDWSREAYTLDATRNRAVKIAFKRLYELGLIYKGSRIVNWDPKSQTTISDDEIEWKEEVGRFYYLKYGPFMIGTARPETKFGDKYVVMHPNDERYSQWKHLQQIEVEWINGPLTATIIKDEAVDMEFGTGCMTITPWHDALDFELAQKHGLDMEQIIDERGILLPVAREFAGQHIKKVRPLIVEKLRAKGLVEKIDENYTHRVATNSRGGGVLEPQIKEQWFVDVNREFQIPHSEIDGIETGETVTLKKLMRHVVESGLIKIFPEHFAKIYFHWVDNLRDWCISRQIWFGHRIPVWYDADGKQHLPKELKIYLARHGQSQDNVTRTIAGADSPLSDTGRDQADTLGRELTGKPITKIVCSNLSRSRETAQIIAKIIGFDQSKIEIWPELAEVDFGSLAGQQSIPGHSPFKRAQEMGTGETLEQLEMRAKKVIEKLEADYINEHVLVVGLNTFNHILDAVLEGRPKEEFVSLRQSRGVSANAQYEIRTLVADPNLPNLHQDEDTFDTWFSSGLWTFTTLGWPQDSRDLKIFHPTTVINPGYEIINLWIARMILMSTALTGQVPFHTALIHGLVRDKQGRKFSKSLNNGVDPLDMIEKYGTDALRMGLVMGAAMGGDVAFDEERIKGQKHFANKLWNIARFVITNLESSNQKTENSSQQDSKSIISNSGANHPITRNSQPDNSQHSHLWGRPEIVTDADRDILSKLDLLIEEVTGHLENYRLHEAAQNIYQFTWHELADVYIEAAKNQLADEATRKSTEKMLFHCLITVLKLLHPFMPFITEHIAGVMKETGLRKYKDPLIISAWPKI